MPKLNSIPGIKITDELERSKCCLHRTKSEPTGNRKNIYKLTKRLLMNFVAAVEMRRKRRRLLTIPAPVQHKTYGRYSFSGLNKHFVRTISDYMQETNVKLELYHQPADNGNRKVFNHLLPEVFFLQNYNRNSLFPMKPQGL